ncbi:glycosyltransferase [Streptomyces sp. 6N223]|uniref:glycosyltransferase n=1 Tax=Streptomyces sp. 6N223 TaxID=3457412 RepID=UPI003FCEF8A4
MTGDGGRVISVVTALHAPYARFLPDAYASLRRQELPDGWRWQWVLQEDGATDAVAGAVARLTAGDPRVSFGQGRPGGPGVARTLALARAAGAYVRVLDADDALTPGALARDVAVLRGEPGIGWVTSGALDWLPDGSTAGYAHDPPTGPVERGALLALWRAGGGRPPVVPGTMAVRRELLLALGGWMALPASEDTGLLLALNAVSRGWFTGTAGLLYRKWPGQSTAQTAHGAGAERAARMAVIEARALALAAMTGAVEWAGPDGDADPSPDPDLNLDLDLERRRERRLECQCSPLG